MSLKVARPVSRLYPARLRLAAEAPAGAGTITIATPIAGQIVQRSGTTGTISVTGTYTGSPTAIEARLVEDGTSTPLASFDWATKDASPSGGTFSFSFASVPQGGWYNVQVRFSNDTSTTDASDKVGVGVLYGIVGQSNSWYWVRSRATATDPNALVRVYGNITSEASWDVPDKTNMAAAIAFGNAVATALSIPVGVLDYGANSGSISPNWIPVGNTINRTFTDGVGAIGDKLEAVIWIQGEGDAVDAETQANYYANLGTLFADWRTQFGQAALPIILLTLGSTTGDNTYATDAEWHAIKLAQIQKAGDANIYRVDRMELPLDDTVHPTAAGFITLGERCAQAALAIDGSESYYRGPAIASAAQSGAVVDVTLTHRGGSDFTPTSGITGFRVLDGGTPATISSAVRQSATVVRLTLSAPPAGLVTVQYLYGKNPTTSGILLDNSGAVLPLEINDGVTAIEVGTVYGISQQIARPVSRLYPRRLYYGVEVAGAAITGSASITLEDATSSSAAKVALAASAGVTLEDASLSAAGLLTSDRVATAAITLEDATASAAGTVAIAGTAGVTLDAASASAVGKVAIAGATTTTLEDASMSATGLSGTLGTAAITLDDATLSAEATLEGPAVDPLFRGHRRKRGRYLIGSRVYDAMTPEEVAAAARELGVGAEAVREVVRSPKSKDDRSPKREDDAGRGYWSASEFWGPRAKLSAVIDTAPDAQVAELMARLEQLAAEIKRRRQQEQDEEAILLLLI